MDLTARCLAWRGLLERGRAGWNAEFAMLERAGIVRREKNTAVLVDEQELRRLLATPEFADVIAKLDSAETLAAAMGLRVRIADRAPDCLRLLMALEKTDQSVGMVWRQQLSAELFGDSKHIGSVSILSRIYEDWLALKPSRGELRLKAFSPLPHTAGGPDLSEVTKYHGQAVLMSSHARPEQYDLSRLHFIMTCENLSPFLELSLPVGILIYTGGYASRGVAAWLKSAPASCCWVHFGDFDPDGLAIFDRLSAVSGRDGEFFPNQETLELLKSDLPAWQGARSIRVDSLRGDRLKGLARWGASHELQAEQEQVLYQLRKRGVNLDELLF
ncbi:hypothetical protein SAMN04488082_108114 [Desulfomicrobium apsheronum]|uniref:Wadjet protein JetD C-terminal domain-containing protein n=1 Tax=Desulfomicrobium apsheronum TaxID=52560 RepID=A0A1I3UW76_9BACT|nr:Wadjet anti-phage system protein JetD domain-containing protein [Desulfomicrobium apsheronum]SFJ86137.1 hypothetical protein SAMN04488082_108114 [Desulfomicrobium apsheronum]